MDQRLGDQDLSRLAELAAHLRGWSPDIDSDQFSGRGIVVAAGGCSVFTNAYVLIHLLRHTLDCRLPIEVWHFGASEMSPAMAALLEEMDVTLVDAEPVITAHGANVRDGWQLKSFALLWSKFEEVLLLDADQVPLIDPSVCFDWPEYRETGAVFWPDVVHLLDTNPVWQAFGLPARRERSMESGQLLVNKRLHLRQLAIVARLNEAADLLYKVIYGDKDTFMLGWELVDAAFAMVPHRPFHDDVMLVQCDFAGQPLFQHRTGGKWRFEAAQEWPVGAAHREACEAALAELERRWGYHVFHAPDRSVAARRAELDLIAAGTMVFEVRGESTGNLELLAHGEIGIGRATDRRNWWCEEQEGAISLMISRPEGVAYRFERVDAGHWSGERLRPPQASVDLTFRFEAPEGKPGPGLVDDLLRAARIGRADADMTGLMAAMGLLVQVEPGMLARLRELAATTDGREGAALGGIIAQLEAAPVARTDVVKGNGVLGAGYSAANNYED